MQKQEKRTTKKGDTKMASKYLNPKADVLFKLVFGEHEDLLMSLLNALLPLDADGQIESLEYLTPQMVPENPAKKGGVQRLPSVFGGYHSIVDVRCKDRRGRIFIVEMQMHWNEEFRQRVILNASKAVVRQLGKGEDYTLIEPVYSLNLVNDKCFDLGDDEFYHDYAIVNVAHSDRIIKGLRFVFVELPKFKPQSILEKKMAVLWLRFLTEVSEKSDEVPAELLENAETNKALGIIQRSAMNKEQLYAYEQFWDAVTNERVFINGGYKKGHEEGLAGGLAKGFAEGAAMERAKIEARMRETVRNLKAMGLGPDEISKITGVTPEDLLLWDYS